MILAIRILKSKITYLLLAVAILLVYTSWNKPKKKDAPPQSNGLITISEEPKEQAITTINRDIASVRTTTIPQPRVVTETIIQKVPSDIEQKASGHPKSKSERRMPIILNIYNKVMDPPKEELAETLVEFERESVPPRFAPYGRLIKCELVNTIDSSNLETPLIGLVMEPVYWNGDLIIPAGSEVHGVAKTNKLRERITSGSSWNLILPTEDSRPNGAALQVTGVALDCDNPSGDGRTFGITDGSFGLKGLRIKSTNMEEIKIFASTFVGALTAGLQNRVPSGGLLGGTQADNSIRDASLGGITAVMTQFAEKIQNEIKDNGFYTRVPAGKQFYLYVQQNINPDHWDMAKKPNTNEKSEESRLLEEDSFIAEKMRSIQAYLKEKHT